MNRLLELPFGSERRSLLLEELERRVPEKVAEVRNDFAHDDIMGEIKALFWIQQAKNKSPVETAKLLFHLQLAVIIQAHAMDLAGSILEELQQRECYPGKNTKDILMELFGSYSAETVISCIQFHRQFPRHAGVSELWSLLSRSLTEAR